MAKSAAGLVSASSDVVKPAARHSVLVRLTHWITTVCTLALLVTGVEILISHPRLYWGETGNVLMRPWLTFPIPSSRSTIPTGYGYVLPDQNGWSRALHFEAAWLLVLTGVLYIAYGILSGHLRRRLLPHRAELSVSNVSTTIGKHLLVLRDRDAMAVSYNMLQQLAYLFVIFLLVPFLIWTGLAMSPAIAAAFPIAVTALGGQQSARTLHFLATVFLLLFIFCHVAMVYLAGFRDRMRAMIIGSAHSDLDKT